MTETELKPEWIAVDRRPAVPHAWAMRGATVLDERPVTGTLDAAIGDWLAAGARDIVQCGDPAEMTPVPAAPGKLAPRPGGNLNGGRLWTLPGLTQSAPVDLMFGAETTIAGFLSLNPNWDGVICLPGAQTHWAQISADEVVSFQSFLSLEILAALGATGVPALDAEFAEAVADTMSRPERLAQRLNAARAGARLGDLADGAVADRMLGALLGAELAAARPYWLGQQIALIGPAEMTAPYAAALQTQAAMVTVAPDARMTLAGLTAAWRRLPGQVSSS
ncbi:2-dehydro-3-deoxygalactonokinase [Seohaeicola saemankumensis]|nr:2-dehydro-3-deoxygalactonokinase [Seohaeicola saemankumensis]MCA0869482.1 2-dehydro-3-deoxygalactonokinase [Seohaeicola saemankumensis]